MIDKFQVGDKVVERGTKAPVMTILGKSMKTGLPQYQPKEDAYICEWIDNLGGHKREFNEDNLELFNIKK